MSLAKKMYIKEDTKVAAVNFPEGLDLDDIKIDLKRTTDKADVVFWFVANLEQLRGEVYAMSDLWGAGKPFWVFYPKKPHLATDLSRDLTWITMGGFGMKGTRQVGISDQWSCMYFKNS